MKRALLQRGLDPLHVTCVKRKETRMHTWEHFLDKSICHLWEVSKLISPSKQFLHHVQKKKALFKGAYANYAFFIFQHFNKKFKDFSLDIMIHTWSSISNAKEQISQKKYNLTFFYYYYQCSWCNVFWKDSTNNILNLFLVLFLRCDIYAFFKHALFRTSPAIISFTSTLHPKRVKTLSHVGTTSSDTAIFVWPWETVFLTVDCWRFPWSASNWKDYSWVKKIPH